MPPAFSIRAPAVIGRERLVAILGDEHNLLQIALFNVSPEHPAVIARTCIPSSQQGPNHLSEQVLRLSQNPDERKNLGWGLSVEPPAECGVCRVERGFIDSQQPTRMKYAGSIKSPSPDIYLEKMTSYVREGSLVQAMVVACREPALEVTWKIGGQIQLVFGQLSNPAHDPVDAGVLGSLNYSVTTFHEGQVLTLTCKASNTQIGSSKMVETCFCLDISLFIDQQAQRLKARNMLPTTLFADISDTGKLRLPNTQDSTCLVLVISLRNPDYSSEPTPPEPSLPKCPDLPQLRRDLMVEDRPMEEPIPTIAETLSGGKKPYLREIPNIIARALSRALNSLVPVRNEIRLMYPIRNALHGNPVSIIDPEECL